MTSIGSNVRSSNKAANSGGPPACAWISLPLEEHLTNFERIIRKMDPFEQLLESSFLEPITKIVKKLRLDPLSKTSTFYFNIGFLSLLLTGTTPLHWAVLMDDTRMVSYILKSRKVDVNASTISMKMTALSYAIIGGNYEIVEKLLEYKADAFMCDASSTSAFGHMVREKDSMFAILKLIVANDVNIHDQVKKTALHYAAEAKAVDVVAYLLNKKANVNLQDQFGYTPLHYAAKKGGLDVVILLLQQNADVNAVNGFGTSPLHLATKEGATNIVSILVEHNASIDAVDEEGEGSLDHSLKYRCIDTFNALIARGANVNFVDRRDKNNALHLAIQAHDREHNMIDIVKLLRERDVDANAKNLKGYSPFFAAVTEGHTEIVKELLQNKEKIKLMEECNGQTVIQVAYDNGHEHIKRVLLECDDVSRYVETLYRDGQVYVDAANAILVGAALIASVTFASWLQPPLGYTTSYLDLAPSSSDINYVDVQHNIPLRAFWLFNTFSFYFAIGTVVFGARSVLPKRQMFIKDIVVKLHKNLLVTSILLACSVFCVIVAFGIAGCLVLTPILKFQWYMIVPTVFGGFVCLVSLGFLFKSMLEENLEKKRKKFSLY